MADTKISQLTTLAAASVASGDWIPIVDVSDTSMAATGTTKKMPATIAFNNLNNNFSASQTVQGGVVATNFRTTTFSIAQDNVQIVTPAGAIGIIMFSVNFFPAAGGIVMYRAASSPFCSVVAGGADLEVTTGILSGTTGNNNKITVSAHTNGNIYIEQRRASSISFTITLFC